MLPLNMLRLPHKKKSRPSGKVIIISSLPFLHGPNQNCCKPALFSTYRFQIFRQTNEPIFINLSMYYKQLVIIIINLPLSGLVKQMNQSIYSQAYSMSRVKGR